MTTPNRPPLWRVIDDAWWSLVDVKEPCNPPPNDQAACVIRALRDWLIQQCRDEGIDQDARNDIYRMLTADADRAERGES